MLLNRFAATIVAAAALTEAQSSTQRIISTLLPQIDAAPSLTPTIYDPTAPDAQECPGYTASNVQTTADGLTAALTLAGSPCQAFGNDIADLILEVQYQTRERLNVRIYPTYLDDTNRTEYLLPASIVNQPSGDGQTTSANSDLELEWSNTPSFQFKVLRKATGEELFSTYGHVLVFEDQFLELPTNMRANYNVYGLAENIHDFYLGQNYTQTFYAVDAGNSVDRNVYGTYPFYQETRYNNDNGKTTAHGVYARNAHGQEWLLRSDNITYRTLGGSFDLYFFSGADSDGSSSALTTIRQYLDVAGKPAMQQFWTFGFHQSRWGYENISVLQDVVANYKKANIPLECIWNDIDVYYLYRDFTNDPETYPAPQMQAFIADLAANNQYYVPIVDSNIYAPNYDNASDAYQPWDDANNQGLFIRDPTTGEAYYGDNWPGFSSWADWLLPGSQEWWTTNLVNWHKNGAAFSGIWIDLSEASSFCVGSCGNGRITENPVHPPFLLPSDPGALDFEYPEEFNITNATEAASAISASASQAALSISLTPATTTTQGRTTPTPGVRNLNYPPYVINNVQAGSALAKGAIAPNATHNDIGNTTEYAMHNLFGLQISNATYNALLAVFPGKRPFTIGRSSFVGYGTRSGHWGGDNTSKFGSMALSISQALTFMMNGVPMFGADTCGFTHNTDYELCSRWMALSAFFPFYRNHNVKASISQEAYIWSSVAEASRRAMNVRYSLLNYMYTLFYYAHTQGDTVMRALAWEFPDDESLKGTFTQFMLGPSILVTPVLVPNVDYVNGVFPGVGDGEIWYDWYTLQPVSAQPQQNVTLSAPLEHINVHIRGGSILPLQQPALTTAAVRNSSFSLLVALDKNGEAEGSLYLDDGVSLEPAESTLVYFKYSCGKLTTNVTGNYSAAPPLANITVVGCEGPPQGMWMGWGQQPWGHNGPWKQHGHPGWHYRDGVVKIQNLEKHTKKGAWHQEMKLSLAF